MTFLYSFLNFFQPGILWPSLDDYRPMVVVSALALAVGLVRKAAYPRAGVFLHPVFLALLAFVAAQVLSVYYGGFGAMLDELSFWYIYPAYVGISFLLIADAASLRRYVWGMMTGCMFVVGYGIYALYEHIGWGVTGRAGAYGMYENHNDYTFIIIQVLPFLFLYFRAERGFFKRALLAASLLACVVGVFLSLSRGGALALVLEAFLIVLLGMQGKSRLVLLPVLALAGAAAIGYQWAKRAENQGDRYTAADAEYSRFELWRAARKIFEAKPVLGIGSRRFPEYSRQYAEISHDNVGKVAHNTYLEVLTGSGLVGFVPFCLMIWWLVRELRRRPAASGPPWLEPTRLATLISLYAILFRALLDSKAHDWSFYTLCAIGLACTALQRQPSAAAAPETLRRVSAPLAG